MTDVPRSRFVTAVAWGFIVFGSVTSLLAAAAMLALAAAPVPSNTEVDQSFNRFLLDMLFDKQPPPWLSWVTSHWHEVMRTLAAGALVGSLLVLLTSVGLLHRQRWSRPAFAVVNVGLCAVIGTAAWLLFEAMRAFYTFGSRNASPEAQAQLQPVLTGLADGVLTLAGCLILPLGLITAKMMSARIAQEFTGRR